NVSGASGVRGAVVVAAAPGDGYTLMVATNDLAIASVMSTKVGYDPIKNFVPISIISRSPSVLLLHPSVPAKTVQEFATLARADHAGERSRRPGNGAGDRPRGTGGHTAVDRGAPGAPHGGIRCPAANARAPGGVRVYCGWQHTGGICRPNQIRYRSRGCDCSR